MEVANQPPALIDYNVFDSDIALRRGLERFSRAGAAPELNEIGLLAGSETAQTWGRLANEYPPVLHTHDRFGNRIDEVEFHPAYHELMRVAARYGLHAAPWQSDSPDAHLNRAAKFYVWGQVEAGHGCPISMTYAGVPALRTGPQITAQWESKLVAPGYDPQLAPIAEKQSALCGMAMTEKQGGSDVRANVTRAQFAQRTPAGDAYLLTGHKWFCSAPMSDAFLVLAQTGHGLTCFFMPRILEDGSRNAITIQRLKDKLGNRSNASSEIESDGASALRLGEEGRGVQTIVEMVNFTRLDCINGSAALMRQAVVQAVHHARHRSTFGKRLIDHPLMQNVLADVALESEAAVILMLRLARSVDRANDDPHELVVRRLGTAIGKYYVCKRVPTVTAEALECLGGNGYVEESGMPRIYREAPLNSIWEGSGNINALDVMRIFAKQPGAIEAFRREMEPVMGDARIRTAVDDLTAGLRDAHEDQARFLVERLALLWQAALIAGDPQSPAGDLFIESRVAGRWGRTMGTLPYSADHRLIVERAFASASGAGATPK